MTTAEQWVRIRALFEQALEVEPEGIEAWLAGRPDAPADLDEVRSLLRHHTRAGAFLAEPVLERLPHLLDDEASRFAPGDVLGAYQIVRELGRGGMGHVYLATDSRLNRDVALKVLAPRLAQDPGQRERLRREARALAGLTHPGICTVYALEEIGDEVVVVTEYIEGRTLREEIEAGQRPSPALLLETTQELATALSKALASRSPAVIEVPIARGADSSPWPFLHPTPGA